MYLIIIINFYYLYFNVSLIKKILNMFSCFVKSVSTLFALVSTFRSRAGYGLLILRMRSIPPLHHLPFGDVFYFIDLGYIVIHN